MTERYKALPADARVVVPLVGRSIPVIRDESSTSSSERAA